MPKIKIWKEVVVELKCSRYRSQISQVKIKTALLENGTIGGYKVIETVDLEQLNSTTKPSTTLPFSRSLKFSFSIFFQGIALVISVVKNNQESLTKTERVQ